MKKQMEDAIKVLSEPPYQGIHGWIFGRANFLKNHTEINCSEAVEVIRAKLDRSRLRRPVETREIIDSVRNAYRPNYSIERISSVMNGKTQVPNFEGAWPPSMPIPRIRKDGERVADIINSEGPWGIPDIISQSEISASGLSTKDILKVLFEEADLLCVGSVKRFIVEPLSLMGYFGEQIVPNPNSKKLGLTKSGRKSGHCRDAVGKRKYLVVEFDDERLQHRNQASLIRHLRDSCQADLRMIVNSGGKSLHAWFKASRDEGLNWQFMSVAVALGADSRMWLPEQFARTPNALRSNGNTQQCLFLRA
mgnify:CR=1 FL=1